MRKHILTPYRHICHPLQCGWRLAAVFLMAALLPLRAAAQGIPFFRNYSATEYQAHNRNFSIATSDDGTVFVANFEGLLYYDKAHWHILHTPNVTRVTSLFRDSKGRVWVGGYNYLGRVHADERGQLGLETVAPQGSVRGEVNDIWERKGDVCILVNEKKVFAVTGTKVVEIGEDASHHDDKGADTQKRTVNLAHWGDANQVLELGGGMCAVATNGGGIVIADSLGQTLCNVTEQNGLCSNNVNAIAYDGHGTLWGATDNGVFAMAVPSAYSRFTASEGLRGEALAIRRFGGKLLVGTLNGLFLQQGQTFKRFEEISHACWQLVEHGGAIWAATSNGVYRVSPDGRAAQMTQTSATSLAFSGDNYYTGEMDGVYLNEPGGRRSVVSDIEKVVRIEKESDGTLYLQGLYGRILRKAPGDSRFSIVKERNGEEQLATLVRLDGRLHVVSSDDSQPIAYPQFSTVDAQGTTWLTDNEGKHLYAWRDARRQQDFSQLLSPLGDELTRTLLHDGQQLWLGNDDGLTCLNQATHDPTLSTQPSLRIRRIMLHGDSILWGGYGLVPKSMLPLASDQRHISFSYAIDFAPMLGQSVYRYRLNGGRWSAWSTSGDIELAGLSYGNYKLEVEARDGYGRHTEVKTMEFSIDHPFYLRWYMNIVYLLVIALLIYLALLWRLRQLNKDKQRLEDTVKERTEQVVKQRDEIVKQKDEIEEKSRSLEQALKDLAGAQHELIRQEKMATVGKLTQGLIDRILNPLNYINNFSKLSQGLVGDIKANIEGNKDQMDEDDYEDTMDVLGMLSGNLQKVSQHGQNTTLTLKAMEEMLKDRTGGIVEMNLASLLRQDADMLCNYYAKDIAQYGIEVKTSGIDADITMHGNPDQLSKTVMCLLGNAVYAVVKKAGKTSYTPIISLDVTRKEDRQVCIDIRDNGIGIEKTILEKVFDPFFTTKTTGEAAGVGLYLSREIVQNHGGDISVESVKDEYTRFTITLPI